jgi:hypothetical protein
MPVVHQHGACPCDLCPSAHLAPRLLHARARLMPRCSTRTRSLLDHEFSRNSTLIHQGCCGCQGRMVDVRITVRCALTRALRAFRRIEERGPHRTRDGARSRRIHNSFDWRHVNCSKRFVQHGLQTRRRIDGQTAGDDNHGVSASRPRFDGQLIRASRRRQCCRPPIQRNSR